MKTYAKYIARIATLFLLFQASAMAAEPVYNQYFPLGDHAYQWRVEAGKGTTTLVIAKAHSPQAAARYDLSDCYFCSGEEDNCEQDGVFPITHGQSQQSTALGVICHIGAHSQRFMIFSPTQTGADPVLDVTGNYFVSTEIYRGGIKVHYDGDEGKQFVRYWPAKAPSSAPIGTRKRPQNEK